MEASSYHATIRCAEDLRDKPFQVAIPARQASFQARTIAMDYCTASYTSHRSFKSETSAVSYSPLSDDEDEIRLISFADESRESRLVHCHLATVSLKSYTSEYHAYTSSLTSRPTKRKVLANWAYIRCPPRYLANPKQDAMDNRVPTSGSCCNVSNLGI